MKLLTTKTEDGERGRSFTAAVLAEVHANVWPQSETSKNTKRPALLSLACESGAAAPLLANLRAGVSASVYPLASHLANGYTVELLRSAGYRYEARSTPNGTRIDAYLPEVFRHTPASIKDDAQVGFVVLPSRAATWVPAEADVTRAIEHLRARSMLYEDRFAGSSTERPKEADVAELLPYGYYLLKFLSGRTGRPLIMDVAFGVQLLVALAGWGSLAFGRSGFGARSRLYEEHLHAHSGFMPGFAVALAPAVLDNRLSFEVRRYLRPNECGER